MGNALVDVLVTLQDDSLLDEMSLPKGSMQLINEDKFLKISGKFSDMKTHKATGGSVGNTVLALANLGAHPGFIGKIGNDDFGPVSYTHLRAHETVYKRQAYRSGFYFHFTGWRTYFWHLFGSCCHYESRKSDVGYV